MIPRATRVIAKKLLFGNCGQMTGLLSVADAGSLASLEVGCALLARLLPNLPAGSRNPG
jgi:hypothetical protein